MINRITVKFIYLLSHTVRIMDNVTTIQELKQVIRKFCEDRDWDQYHSAKELAIAIITESSELLDLFRFKSEKEIDEMFNDRVKRDEIADEIADILFFLLRLSQRYDINLSTELKRKIKKNEKRYPICKSKGSNKKYDEL